MHYLLALLAGCLLYPPPDDPCREARAAQYEFLRSHGAQNVEWNANGKVKVMKPSGIFLRAGIADREAGARCGGHTSPSSWSRKPTR
jgi:hypothetical protein